MIHKNVFLASAKRSIVVLCVLGLIISSFSLTGCSYVDMPEPFDCVKLGYFRANRYTATIIENDQYIFWADSHGINRREKNTKAESLIFKIDGANHLSLYGNHLYFVTNDQALHRVDLTKMKDEILFDSRENENYLSQINDYCVVDNKIFFLNTHSLFYFDINSKKSVNLLDTSVYTLQVVDNTIYFLDKAERTFTLYSYSIETKESEKIIGYGITEPLTQLCSDFRIIDGKIIYSLREPYETRVLKEDGSTELVFNGELNFSVSGANWECLYSILKINEAESCLYVYTNGEQKMIATLPKMNIASGFAIIDGYVYYNSGDKTIIPNVMKIDI